MADFETPEKILIQKLDLALFRRDSKISKSLIAGILIGVALSVFFRGGTALKPLLISTPLLVVFFNLINEHWKSYSINLYTDSIEGPSGWGLPKPSRVLIKLDRLLLEDFDPQERTTKEKLYGYYEIKSIDEGQAIQIYTKNITSSEFNNFIDQIRHQIDKSRSNN